MSQLAIFSKEARSALVAAEVHLGKDALAEIFRLVLNALEPSTIPQGATPHQVGSIAYEDTVASNLVLARLGRTTCSLRINTGGKDENTDVTLVGNDTENGTFVDFHTQLCDAAKADLTGFILEALQFHSTRAISVGEADIIATHVESCKTLLGIPEEGK